MLHFILDGYNVIRSDASGRLGTGSLEEQRDRLVRLIRERRPEGSATNRVTVVFDGARDGRLFLAYESHFHAGPVEVLFSDGCSADETIEQLVEESPRAAEIVVVSDDRGIRRRIGGTGARLMPVAVFLARLFSRRDRPDDGPGGADDVTDELSKKWL
jgi:predicted RNA-binding protein with PIN domain